MDAADYLWSDRSYFFPFPKKLTLAHSLSCALSFFQCGCILLFLLVNGWDSRTWQRKGLIHFKGRPIPHMGLLVYGFRLVEAGKDLFMTLWIGALTKLKEYVFKKWPFLGSLDFQSPKEVFEKRRYDRFSPVHPDLITVTFANGTRAYVSNLSYGGFACVDSPDFPDLGTNPKQLVSLNIFGRSQQCHISFVHTQAGISAFSIIHTDSAANLLFLRDSIEPMRQGSTIAAVPTHILRDRYGDGTWTYLRGEGPTDVLIRTGVDGSLMEALMTLSRDTVYNEIRYENGRLSTGISLDRTGIAASRMAAHQHPEMAILHHGAAILACVNSSEAALPVGQFLREVLNARTIASLSQTVKNAG